MDFKELDSALTGKGHATPDNQGDHVFYYITVDGKKHRATKLSHGVTGQIDASLLSLIARQMRLTLRELRTFQKCDLGRDEWVRLWKERGEMVHPTPRRQQRQRRKS